ncbi:uncharacterized protein MELLADRAFT_113961 [Melampsora larici-populina 98AG31]|uniref:Uncharacterized protein n=1 Tax=Melampsora larici-populina (strain 98AG31 / pathotype 3-4-7) TaxID=747676 RepID=F4SBP0_MELLP|nr:uncharacterized protein MELLADRAFT_113961 [Melampsora larici-populina 98AG31]EGF97940.1 hypothetical protein MELLADRAFT_113961 [Melampsora larici-populina 98AG31]
MGGQHLERVVKKRRLAPKSNVTESDQQTSQQAQQKRGLQQLATTQNPGPPPPALLPSTNSILPAIHTTLPVGNLNLSPIVSAVSAPSWMDLSSSQPTPTATPNPVTSSASVATPTSSPTKIVSTISANPSPTDNSIPQPKTIATSSCLGSQCTTMITTSNIASSTASSIPVSGNGNSAGPNDFFQSLGSSAGSIFVTTLVGLAILGVIFAISSWGLRRWCNRRRKKIIDDDTWKFLNTPQEFSKRALDDDVDSIKSMPHGFSGQIPHVLLHNDLPHSSTPSHLFSTHLQAPPPTVMNQVNNDPTSTSQFHSFVGFHPSQPPPRMSCFMDDGQLSWISNPTSNSIAPIYGGVILAPIGTASTDHLPSSSIPTAPEPAYGSPRVEMSQVQDGLLRSSSSLRDTMTSRIRSFVSISNVETEESTPLTKLPIPLPRTRQHPLSREISIARSDDSSSIEILRERVKDQRTNIRSKLIESIQSESIQSAWSPSDLLNPTTNNSDSLIPNPYVPIEKCQPTTPRPLRVQKKESLIRYQLTDTPLSRELSQASCYSVTTTVVGHKPMGNLDQKG